MSGSDDWCQVKGKKKGNARPHETGNTDSRGPGH